MQRCLTLKYSGKAKDVVSLDDDKVKIIFRNSISAFDGVKLDELEGKGSANCRISVKLFQILEKYGIETHFIEKGEQDNVIICKKVDIIPVEAVCRNIAAGSFCRRYGVEQGLVFKEPLVEFFYKNDELHDPLVTEDAAVLLGWMTEKEAQLMRAITKAVNKILVEVFKQLNIQLVDFKLEFGRLSDGKIVLADEISADTMRLWEQKTGEVMDKDRYRKDLGNVVEHYQIVAEKLEKIDKLPQIDMKTVYSVVVDLKPTVLDPAGEITQRSLDRLGYSEIKQVRLGKNILLKTETAPNNTTYNEIEKVSEEILSNSLIETFSVDVDFI